MSGSRPVCTRSLLLQASIVLLLLQGLSDVCWNREGGLLATASDDATLRLWDAETGQSLRVLEGHTHYVFSCCFSEGGNLLVRGWQLPRRPKKGVGVLSASSTWGVGMSQDIAAPVAVAAHMHLAFKAG